jgi:transposase
VRDELTERQWARLLPLLPPQKPPRGRPTKDHSTVLNAILWVMLFPFRHSLGPPQSHHLSG